MIGEAISNERNAGAVARGNAALQGALNTALAKLQADVRTLVVEQEARIDVPVVGQ